MGWEPRRTTTVTAWTEDGRPSQWVTETEPEFDVNERDNWDAWDEYQDSLCPQCHQLRAVCEDPDQQWSPQLHECRASAVMMASSRRWARLNEKTKPDYLDRHPADGTQVWIAPADTAPSDVDFLGLADAVPDFLDEGPPGPG
jgi:hypothetical protein